jgi:4-aminobutyrate aminotransferase/(S)-3-amino-2-methylpropionate transaminase
VACAAALAVLDVFEEERLVEKASYLGETARARMLQWYQAFPLVGDVRGLGAMMAIELVRDSVQRTPAVEETAAVLSGARERGLILIKAGLFDNVVRLLMPLVTTSEQMERGLDILQATLTDITGQTTTAAH